MIDTEGGCAEWTFPAVPNAVRTARHAVRDALHAWGLDPDSCDVTVLLVSELVTNSLRYTPGPIGVRLVRPPARSQARGRPEAQPQPLDQAQDRTRARVRPRRSQPQAWSDRDHFRTPRPDGASARGAHFPEDTAAPRTGLLVEVSDPLPDPPTERTAHPDDEGGRGLQLVACSARRWGTRRGKTGKTVWFELALPG
ncbi:ATP-binding protein [Streptomyces sp. DT171]|uniref:ATP-binding protein n=1 Tax=Streptomyces sp. DT171 TaxID=3416524 RepID=UPI003CEE9C35